MERRPVGHVTATGRVEAQRDCVAALEGQGASARLAAVPRGGGAGVFNLHMPAVAALLGAGECEVGVGIPSRVGLQLALPGVAVEELLVPAELAVLQREDPDLPRLEDDRPFAADVEGQPVVAVVLRPEGPLTGVLIPPPSLHVAVRDPDEVVRFGRLPAVLHPGHAEGDVEEAQLGGLVDSVIEHHRHVERVPHRERRRHPDVELVGVLVLGLLAPVLCAAWYRNVAQHELDLHRDRHPVDVGVFAREVVARPEVVVVAGHPEVDVVDLQGVAGVRIARLAVRVFHHLAVALVVGGEVLNRHLFLSVAVEGIQQVVGRLAVHGSTQADRALEQRVEIALHPAFPHVGEQSAGPRGHVVEEAARLGGSRLPVDCQLK